MNIPWILRACATLGPIGYLPASGTLASLITLPFIYWLHSTISTITYSLITIIFMLVGWYLIDRTCTFYALHDDPPSIVLDEVIGMLVAFWLIPWCTDLVILTFLSFRFFDITKLLGISFVEQLPGATGIIADDFLAALYTQFFVHLYIWLIY